MISLSKLIVLVFVIAAVWFGWRWITRVEKVGRERLQRRQADTAAGRGGAQGNGNPAATNPWNSGPTKTRPAEDMEKCPECGVYVAPASATPCGRPGCPYGRG